MMNPMLLEVPKLYTFERSTVVGELDKVFPSFG
jgi:hypothetical protein